MGRPVKSERDHALQGTVSQSKSRLDSKFAGGRPKVPRHLPPEARSKYKRAVHFLERRGTLTEADYGTLTVYATVFSRWLQAKSELGKSLLIETVVTDNNGIAHTTKRLNPLLKVVDACEGKLLAMSKSLGLTPVDRDRVRPVSQPELAPELVEGTGAWWKAQQQPALVPVVVNPADMIEEDADGNEQLD